MLKDALNSSCGADRGLVKRLHLNWGRASARRLTRISVDAKGATEMLLEPAGSVAQQCEVPRALHEDPHWPVAGAPMVSSFYEKVQVGLLFADDVDALRAMGMCSKNSLLVRVRSEGPSEGRGSVAVSKMAGLGQFG